MASDMAMVQSVLPLELIALIRFFSLWVKSSDWICEQADISQPRTISLMFSPSLSFLVCPSFTWMLQPSRVVCCGEMRGLCGTDFCISLYFAFLLLYFECAELKKYGFK